jgi:glycerophosphoryl diester phosphodiesterase
MAIQVIAHRGASAEALENSLAAFRRAVALGADGIELDVHSTLDGAFVVHHDPVVPGVGPIAAHSLEQLRVRSLPNGEPLPTLEEALEAAGALDVWVEVKALEPAHDSALLGLLRRSPHPERYSVHSFDHRVVQRLCVGHPELRGGALLTAYLMDPVRALADAHASVLWQEWSMIDRKLVDHVHESGRTIIAWTVDAPAELVRLSALGVDGLCTNHPDRARHLLGR